MKAIFRCDSGKLIGSGHLSRCILLAKFLERYGYNVEFISRNHKGNFNHIILNNNFKLNQLELKKINLHDKNNSYKSWLGASVEEDVNDTIEIIKYANPSLLIVDHYAVDEEWEKQVKKYTKKILVIDDLANRKHFCDILIDNNYLENFQERYDGLTNKKCIRLLGPSYTFINPSYFKFKKNNLNFKKNVQKILIYMGGGDVDNITIRLINYFINSNYNLEITVVSSEPQTIKKKIHKNTKNNIDILSYQKDLSVLFSNSDLIIGGGGVTTWERLFLSVPSIVISVADNQVAACKYLEKQKFINYFGHVSEFNNKNFKIFFEKVLFDLHKSKNLKTKNLIDGNGLNRLIKIINEKNFCNKISLTSEPNSSTRFNLQSNDLKIGSLTHSTNKDVICYSYRLSKDFKNSPTLSNSIFFKLSCFYNTILINDNFLYFSKSKNYKYKVSLLTDKNSWINTHIENLVYYLLRKNIAVSLVHDQSQLQDGDYCFLLGCSQILKRSVNKKFKKIFVVHESDLPKGRGWSPLSWEILNNSYQFYVSLIQISDRIDSGNIYLKKRFKLKGNELYCEWKKIQANYSFIVIKQFLLLKNKDVSLKQLGDATYYKRRKPEDSELNINLPLIEQFNLLRIVDNDSFPAFFRYRNSKFFLKISKDENND